MTTARERIRDLKHLGQEMGLVNLVLNHPDLYLECLDVEVRHFSEPLYRHLWVAIQAANEQRGQGGAPPTLASILHERDPELVRIADERYGGFHALRRDFVELQCRRERIYDYRNDVLAMANQRVLVAGVADLAEQVDRMATPLKPNLEAMQDAVENGLADILRDTRNSNRNSGLMAEMESDAWIQEQQRLVQQEGEISSFQTGIPIFDAFEILVPGRVTMWIISYKRGKSTVGCHFAARLAIGCRMASYADVLRGQAGEVGQVIHFRGEDGLPIRTRRVSYIDLEMGKDRDVQPRILSCISGVPHRLIANRKYLRDQSDTTRVQAAYDWLHRSGMRFAHGGTYDIRWVRNTIREMYYRYGTEVQILDYLRAPPGMNEKERYDFEIRLADTVKQLTEDLGMTTITFQQFDRQGRLAESQRSSFAAFRKPSSANIQGAARVNNFVDTILVQDDHHEDPRIKRWWIDSSRITEAPERDFMRVEYDFARCQIEIPLLESIGEDERPRRKKKEDGPPATAGKQEDEEYVPTGPAPDVP